MSIMEDKIKEALQTSNNFRLFANEEISPSTGVLPTNESENRLFIWQFDVTDIRSLVSYFNEISDSEFNNSKFRKIKEDLKSIGKDIEKNNVYPVEAILYASKLINNRLTDLSLRVCLAEVIEYFLVRNEVRGEKVIRHICKNWTWSNQQKISILAAKALNNMDILSLIYNEFHDRNEVKLECFTTLIMSGNEEALDMILNMVCNLNSDYEVDIQIRNLFANKFEEKFLIKGVKAVQDVKSSRPGITRFGRRALDGIGVELSGTDIKLEGSNLSELIQIARSGIKNNEDYFSKNFIGTKNKRKSVLLALRYSTDKDYASKFLYELYNKNKTKIDSDEIKDTALSLALLGSDKSIEICKTNENITDIKPYEWGARIILGDDSVSDFLAEDYFEEKIGNISDYKKIVRGCINRNKALTGKIEKKFKELIVEANESDFCKYLKIIKNFIREYNNIASRQIILDMINDKESSLYKRIIESSLMQNAIINTLGDLVNEDTIKLYQNTLFLIAKNPDFNIKIKTKANSILKDYIPPSELEA